MFAVKPCTLTLATCIFLVVHASRTAKSMRNGTKYAVSPQNSNQTEKNNCRGTVRNEETSKFIKLTEHSLVNIVDMRFVIKNNYTTFTKTMIWMNSVGREILLLLDMERLLITSTLNAGRRSIDIHIGENPKGCAWINESIKYYVETRLMTFYGGRIKVGEEFCYSLSPTMRKPRWCCRIIKNGRKRKWQCSVGLGFQLGVHLNLKLMTLIYFPLSLFTVNALYISALYLQQFPHDSIYYKLSTSPMSLTGIVIKIAQGGNFYTHLIRIFCFTFAILSLSIASKWYGMYLLVLYMTSMCSLLYSIIGLVISLCSLSTCSESGSSSTTDSCGKRLFNFLVKYYKYVFHANSIKGNEFHRAVHLLTLPFNIILWTKAIRKNKLNRIAGNVNANIIIKGVVYCACKLILLFYIVVLIGLTIIILCINLCYNAVKISAIFYRHRWATDCYSIVHYPLLIFATLTTLLYASFLWYLLPHAVIPLFAGLILNSVYYFPHVTLISVASFYTWALWKSLTGEYLTLKIMIYEALQQGRSNNNVNLDDISDENLDDISDDRYTVHVVSKKLYQKIRERLLPYHFKFLVFFLKLLLISVFALGVSKLVIMLQAVDASPTVIMIATFTTGALPYILNIVIDRMSEEEKKTHNVILQGNVEQLVKKFATDDQNLSRTIWTSPEQEIFSELDSDSESDTFI